MPLRRDLEVLVVQGDASRKIKTGGRKDPSSNPKIQGSKDQRVQNSKSKRFKRSKWSDQDQKIEKIEIRNLKPNLAHCGGVEDIRGQKRRKIKETSRRPPPPGLWVSLSGDWGPILGEKGAKGTRKVQKYKLRRQTPHQVRPVEGKIPQRLPHRGGG